MITQFANETAFIIGSVTLLGLLLQKKTPTFIMESTVKVVIGYFILQFGAYLATQQLSELIVLIERTFNVQGIMPNDEMIASLSLWFYGQTIGYIMLIGMAIHLLIARYTRFKYIFLTGHHILYMAALLAGIMAGSKFNILFQVIFGGIVLAISMTAFPAICQPMMNQIIPDKNVAIGHFGSVGYAVSGLVAKQFGKVKSNNIKHFKISSMGILNHPNVIITAFMFCFFLITALIAGEKTFSRHSGSNNVVLYAFLQSFQFTAAIYIIIVGVRMMLTEILTSFKGIADKIVPNAIPALDSPVIFPHAPTAVVIGFSSSLIGGFIGLMILVKLNVKIVVPAIMAHFLSGGTSGVFGYVMGGYRGAILGSIVHGLFITFIPLFLLPVMYHLGYAQTTFSESDFGIVGLIVYYLLEFLQALR